MGPRRELGQRHRKETHLHALKGPPDGAFHDTAGPAQRRYAHQSDGAHRSPLSRVQTVEWHMACPDPAPCAHASAHNLLTDACTLARLRKPHDF